MFFSNRIPLGLVALGCVLLVGCTGGVRIAPAEGTVTKGGKPLDKIMVEFYPEVAGPRSFAETDANGHFELTTDDGKRKGAVVGPAHIVLKDTAVLGDKFLGRAGENTDMSQGRKPRFGKDYNNNESTPLRVEVKADGNNFNLDLPTK